MTTGFEAHTRKRRGGTGVVCVRVYEVPETSQGGGRRDGREGRGSGEVLLTKSSLVFRHG